MKNHMERVRMDAETLASLQELALELGVSRSEVIRQLIWERVATKGGVATNHVATEPTKRERVATPSPTVAKVEPSSSVATVERSSFQSFSKSAQSKGFSRGNR